MPALIQVGSEGLGCEVSGSGLRVCGLKGLRVRA